MSTPVPVDTDLHLPDLHIKGFRGIKDLLISRLGRVTLLAGKNGTGKTTVLEAVKVYSAGGRFSALGDLLRSREETTIVFDEDLEQDILAPNWDALFHERIITHDSLVSIGPVSGDQLSITTTLAHDQLTLVRGSVFPDDKIMLIQVNYQSFKQEFPLRYSEMRKFGNPIITYSDPPLLALCESLGPGLPSSRKLASLWDKVALTDDESKAVEALNLIYSNRVERVAMVGDDIGGRNSMGRRPVVKLRDEPRPVPLKSLGDGAVRLFGVALALANSKDGFLLIDEAENGIHHSIQRDFWTMILKAAHQNNAQVLATTHSWDCVAGFAKAATEIEEVDGALVRLEKKGDRLRAVEYPNYDLDVIAQQGIEVR